jgi:hypothetical protein
MNRVCAVAFSVFVLVGATSAYAEQQDPEMPGVSHLNGTEHVGVGSMQDDQQSHPLFTFGGLDVRVWTPVDPPYSALANGDPAGQPYGGAG